MNGTPSSSVSGIPRWVRRGFAEARELGNKPIPPMVSMCLMVWTAVFYYVRKGLTVGRVQLPLLPVIPLIVAVGAAFVPFSALGWRIGYVIGTIYVYICIVVFINR